MEITINDTRVVLKDRLTAREAWPVLQIIRKTAAAASAGAVTSYDEEVTMMRTCIQEWGFGGDPQDPEAYGDLDAFREFVPLSNQVGLHLRNLVMGDAEAPVPDGDLADAEPMPKN